MYNFTTVELLIISGIKTLANFSTFHIIHLSPTFLLDQMEKDEGEAIYAEIGSPHPRTAGAASAGTRLLAHPQQTSVTTSVPNQRRPLPQAPASDEGQDDNIALQETLLGIP